MSFNGGIYQIKNIINGKVYIGSAKDFDDRWGSHLYDLRKNTHINPHLQRSFIKHGEKNFIFGIIEILGEYNKEIYFAHENIYIDQARATGLFYNIAKAEGGWSYHTEERKKEISAKLSKSLKSYCASLSQKERSKKYGKGKFGIIRSLNEKQKISEKLKGIPKTIETRNRISKAKLGVPKSVEAKNNMRNAKLGKPGHSRKVVLVDNQRFDSLKDAASFLKTCSSVLCTVIKRDKKFRKIYNVRYEE